MYEDLNTSEPLVVLLGNIGHEGILSSLKAAGRQYKQKFLESKPRNWATIIEYFDDFSVKAVIAKLSPSVYEHLVDDGYRDVGHALLRKISSVPHVLFVFEGLLDPMIDAEFSDAFHIPEIEIRNAVNTLLAKFELNVVPYRRNAEVTVIAGTFVSETEDGLLFRVYVPAGRIWAEEINRLLQLFRDYLGKVGLASIRLDAIRTDRGTVYEFHGEQQAGEQSLSTQFREFSHFLDISISRPEEAEALLKDKNVNPREVVEVLARYAKEAKRLQVDLKQERERKLLSIRHRLESELTDTLPADTDWAAIDTLVATSVPALSNIGPNLLAMQTAALPIVATTRESNGVTINLRPQIIQAVHGIVAQEIQGGLKLSEEDQELLKLINERAKDRAPELTSAVYELSDENLPKANRTVAKQKLKRFLVGLGNRAGDLAFGVLQAYVEKKLGL